MCSVRLVLVKGVCHVMVETPIADQVYLEVGVHFCGNRHTCLCVLFKTSVCYRESIANKHLAEVKCVARDKVSQREPDDTFATRWTCAANHIREICVAYVELDC